jgi:AraC family transcriptional regulator
MSSSAPCVHVRASRTIGGTMPIGIAQVDYSRGAFVDAPASDFALCLIQQGSGEIQSSFDGGRSKRQHFRSGMFVPLTPPNTRAEFVMSAPMRHLMITLPASAFNDLCGAGDVAADVAGLQERGFRDALLEQIVLAMWSESQGDGATGGMSGDSLRAALTWAICRRANRSDSATGSCRGLTGSEVARVRDYLAAHMGEPVLISDLAGLLDMQERTFSLAFRKATGCSPYQFFMDLRIEAAKGHLAGATTSIAEIAELTGFADQAHLTTMFSRHVGVSPARYRKACRT